MLHKNKFMALWRIPFKPDWEKLSPGRIPIVEASSGRLVFSTAGRNARDLHHARRVIQLHNDHVRAFIKQTKKAKTNATHETQ